MLKPLLKSALRSLGYSLARVPASPKPGSALPPPPAPPLRPLSVDLFPGFPVELDLSDTAQRLAVVDGPAFGAPGPALLCALCTDDATFFDIGANFGYFSYYVLAHAPRAVVHSFEPNPQHAPRQRAVAAARAPRYHPHQLGLSDAEGELVLNTSSLDSGWSTFGDNPHFKPIGGTLSAHRVPVTTFDAWREGRGLALPASPSWVVKMDVEGYEPRVLRGMAQALAVRAFKALYIEILDHTLNFCGSDAAEVFRLLDAAGYSPFDEQLLPTVRRKHEARNVLFLPRA